MYVQWSNQGKLGGWFSYHSLFPLSNLPKQRLCQTLSNHFLSLWNAWWQNISSWPDTLNNIRCFHTLGLCPWAYLFTDNDSRYNGPIWGVCTSQWKSSFYWTLGPTYYVYWKEVGLLWLPEEKQEIDIKEFVLLYLVFKARISLATWHFPVYEDGKSMYDTAIILRHVLKNCLNLETFEKLNLANSIFCKAVKSTYY